MNHIWNEAWLPGIPEDVPLPEDDPFVPELQQKARELLESKEVGVVIGYGWAKRQRRTIPVFITDPNDVSKLTFNSLCVNNLSVFLPKKQQDIAKMGKPAIVAKGCDVKTMVVLLQEDQITRDGVVILGVSCSGSIYRQELWQGTLEPKVLSPKCVGCDVQTPHMWLITFLVSQLRFPQTGADPQRWTNKSRRLINKILKKSGISGNNILTVA